MFFKHTVLCLRMKAKRRSIATQVSVFYDTKNKGVESKLFRINAILYFIRKIPDHAERRPNIRYIDKPFVVICHAISKTLNFKFEMKEIKLNHLNEIFVKTVL